MARIAWVFHDPVTLDSYSLPVNPNSGASPEFAKNASRKTTTGPGGATLIFEGADEPQSFNFSGTILTQEQYEAFVEWWDKRRIIQITDDLGRDWNVYFQSFRPTRKISTNFPWRHEYSVEAVVVD